MGSDLSVGSDLSGTLEGPRPLADSGCKSTSRLGPGSLELAKTTAIRFRGVAPCAALALGMEARRGETPAIYLLLFFLAGGSTACCESPTPLAGERRDSAHSSPLDRTRVSLSLLVGPAVLGEPLLAGCQVGRTLSTRFQKSTVQVLWRTSLTISTVRAASCLSLSPSPALPAVARSASMPRKGAWVRGSRPVSSAGLPARISSVRPRRASSSSYQRPSRVWRICSRRSLSFL